MPETPRSPASSFADRHIGPAPEDVERAARQGRSGLRVMVSDAKLETFGAVHGYEVRSSSTCRFLRHPASGDPLEVREAEREPQPVSEPILEWTPRPLRDFTAKLFTDDGWMLMGDIVEPRVIASREPTAAPTASADAEHSRLPGLERVSARTAERDAFLGGTASGGYERRERRDSNPRPPA